jgi:hypothetical protein
VPRIVALFSVEGWCWDWVREVRELVFALDAEAAGQQPWRQLARQGALRGKRVAVLPAVAYGGYKDVSDAWATRVRAVGPGPAPAPADEALAVPLHPRASGRSVLRSGSWTVASRARKPSASRGRGSRPRAPCHAACPVASQVLAHLGGSGVAGRTTG